MGEAFENSFEDIQKSSGTSYVEKIEKTTWQSDQRFQVWRKIKTTLVLNGKKSVTTEEKCVRSVASQPSEEELKKLALDHLTLYYFKGVEARSPVFEFQIVLENHVGPTVRELTTIQKIKKKNRILNDKIKFLVGINNAAIGTISIWKGTRFDIPRGWVLCDGRNDTPNLSDRFVLSPGKRPAHTTGGMETVKLTVEEMPSHEHNYTRYGDVQELIAHIARTSEESPEILSYELQPGGWKRQGNTYYSNEGTKRVGGNQPHENMPPFYTLAYIMKVQ